MKLPESKKERIQVLILVLIGAVAVIYAVTQLGIVPLMRSRKDNLDKLGELQKKLNIAKVEFKYAPQLKLEYDQTVSQLQDVSTNYVLRPVLGSYLLGVNETIENAARAGAFTLTGVREIGIQELPGKQKDGTPHAFKSFSVQVAGWGSYEQSVALLRLLEENNPYLCVTDIDMAGQPENPERHRIGFRVEWPIAVEPLLSGTPAAGEPQPTGVAPP